MEICSLLCWFLLMTQNRSEMWPRYLLVTRIRFGGSCSFVFMLWCWCFFRLCDRRDYHLHEKKIPDINHNSVFIWTLWYTICFPLNTCRDAVCLLDGWYTFSSFSVTWSHENIFNSQICYQYSYSPGTWS